MRNKLFLSVLVSFFLCSCGAGFWEGMGNYGGYRSMYSGVPYGLQPSVAAQQAGQIIRNQTQSQIDNFWTSGAANAVVVEPTTSGGGTVSSSYSGGSNSSASGSSSGRLCRTCSGGGKCNSCHGSGMRTDNQFGTGTSSTVRCGVCGGSGRCSSCNGAGRR